MPLAGRVAADHSWTNAREAAWQQRSTLKGWRPAPPGLKPKDLVGIPWRVAFALQADGWYLRSDIIWSKPNPMPESVTDRPTKAHEYLFLLAKRERYYYDAEAIKEPSSAPTTKMPDGWDTGPGSHRTIHRDGREKGRRTDKQAELGKRTYTGFNDRWDANPISNRNRRSVWEIATQPYPEAHFATFPEALVEPCVLAGTSEYGVCGACGAPWERVVERTGHVSTREPAHQPGNTPTKTDSTGWAPATRATDQWQPACACDAEGGSCYASIQQPLVLDPFAGSGTVGLVCQRLGRRFVGLELKPDYCRMAYARTAQLGLV
jgi:DNA modification methylase